MITEWITGKITGRVNRLKRSQWLGCFISIAGVWLVAGVSFAVSGSILGYIYMCGAALSWVAYSFFTRSLFKEHSVIFIVFWQSVAGFLCLVPFSVMEFNNWGTPSVQIIIHLLFLAVFCSAIGHWFYVIAMETLSVTISGIFLNVIPIITVIAGFFVLGELLTPLQWLGAALVISGVYLAMLSNRKQKI
jgi:drug/metabolite transporter (DMT)-like permease